MFLFLLSVFSLEADDLVLGFATGFPPYQYQDERGRPKGLDIEIAKVVFHEMDVGYRIDQGPWDDIVARLRLGQGLDLVGGMEISGERKLLFDFSDPLYLRKNMIFVLKDDPSIRSIDDLEGRVITGDRNSFIETLITKSGRRPDIRIIETETKEGAMGLLKSRRAEACLMPYEVGIHLAQKLGVPVRTVDAGDPGTPVAFAVRKGDRLRLEHLNQAIRQAREKGLLAPLLKQFTTGA